MTDTSNPMLRSQLICSAIVAVLQSRHGMTDREGLVAQFPKIPVEEYDFCLAALVEAKIVTVDSKYVRLNI